MYKKNNTHQLLLIILLLPMLLAPAQAKEWKAVQGDVVTVEIISNTTTAKLRCFGRDWPVEALSDGRIRGWVGVDLKKKPGSYQLQWVINNREFSDSLKVEKGNFRISRIEVKKNMASFDAKSLARLRRDQAALKHTYTMHVDATPTIHMHGMPVSGITSTPFGAQRYVNGEARSPHSGIDTAAAEGTPVFSPLAGKVLLKESMYLNGNTIVVGHGYGLVSVFSHLHEFQVNQGDWVKTGQQIATVGQTGRATGPHLHWGVRFKTARVNPESLLNNN